MASQVNRESVVLESDRVAHSNDSLPIRTAADAPKRLWSKQKSDWLGRRLSPLVIALVVAESLIMIALEYRQHVNFGTYGYDVGLYDQAMWLLGHDPFSSPFLTSRGLPVWGHHVNPILLLLSPLTRLGAGVMFFSAAQTFIVFLGALPVSWLIRSKTGSAEAGLGMAVVYLLYPPIIFFSFSYFHPELLAPLPMLLAAWFAHRKRYGLMWINALIALACREEISVALAAFGAVLLLGALRRRDRRLIAHSVVMVVVCASWFVICTKVIIPAALGGEPFYLGTFYGKYGQSYGEIARNLVADPSLARGLITEGNRDTFLLDLFGPLLFLPAFGLPIVMCVAPLLGLLMASSEHSHSIQSHYAAIMIPGLFLATIEVLRVAWRRRIGPVLLALVVVTSSVASIARSPAPWGVNSMVWKTSEPQRAALKEAVALIPDDARVSTMGNIAPHLSHRRVLYQFPNPLERWIYGEFALADMGGENGPPAKFPEPVDWILVQRSGMGRFAQAFNRAVDDGTFEIVFDEGDVLVARRRSLSAHDDGAP